MGQDHDHERELTGQMLGSTPIRRALAPPANRSHAGPAPLGLRHLWSSGYDVSLTR